MPIYVYLTETGDRVEVLQGLTEAPLTHHPATNEKMTRIICSIPEIKTGRAKRGLRVNKKSPAATACGCSKGVPHHH